MHKPHDRWLIADVDNIDDPLPSLGRQLHNDTQLKLLIAPQLAINNQKIADVTIAELLAHPDEYHSRKVRIRGLVLIGFERHAIYGDPQQDGLWLENFLVPYTVSRNHTEASMVVEGIFDMRVSGHLSHYPGGITNITRYEKVQPTRASAVTDISFTDLLQHPDHYHQKKYVYADTLFSVLNMRRFMPIKTQRREKMDFGWEISSLIFLSTSRRTEDTRC